MELSNRLIEEIERRGRPAYDAATKDHKKIKFHEKITQIVDKLGSEGRPIDQINVADELKITDRALRLKLGEYEVNWKEIKKAEVKIDDN